MNLTKINIAKSRKFRIFASSFNRQKDREKAHFSIPLEGELGHFTKA